SPPCYREITLLVNPHWDALIPSRLAIDHTESRRALQKAGEHDSSLLRVKDLDNLRMIDLPLERVRPSQPVGLHGRFNGGLRSYSQVQPLSTPDDPVDAAFAWDWPPRRSEVVQIEGDDFHSSALRVQL